MVGGVGFTRFGGIIAAALVGAISVASADQPLPRSQFAPIPTPIIKPDSLVQPYTTPKFDLGAIDQRKFHKERPEVSFDTIDFGKSTLRLDVADAATRPLADTPDLTEVIVPLAPGKKRTKRRYFGFTLTTQTN
jgi:hypothetical protein